MQVALPDVRHAVDEADRPGADCIGDDRRQAPPHREELVEQRQRAAEHPAPARQAGRRDEHEAPHLLGAARRDLRRDQAAERVADHVHAAEPRRVEEAAEPGGELPRAQAAEVGQLDEAEPAALR